MKNKIILSVILLFTVNLFPQTDTALTFNEVMFKPSASNSEFIELFNTSITETIDLNNFKFKYHTSSTDIIISTGNGTLLPPKSYAVIFEGDYDFTNGIYSGLIPASALVLKLNNKAFGSSGMSNSSNRQIILFNSAGDTLDVYTYSANNSTGISDEKITTKKDNASTNWANSTQTNGTPGFRNSVTPLNNDLVLSSLTTSPSINLAGNDINISATIKNTGTQSAGNYSIEIFNDTNFDLIGALSEKIFSQLFTNLSPNDSTIVNTVISNPSTGVINLIAKVNYTNDEDTTNNSKIITINVFPILHLFSDIVINEIMYAPSSGQTEWVELYNRTDSSVNLNGWSFSDNNTTVTFVNTDVNIPSKSFVVLSKDSTVLTNYSIPVKLVVFSNMPTLNNSGDAVVIKDSLDILIDSLTYSRSWGGDNGKSLERIDIDDSSTKQSNWGTSISSNEATPGLKNSLTPFDNDLAVTLLTHSPELIIEGNNVNVSATIKNVGKISASSFAVNLYNDSNFDNVASANELIFTQNYSNLIIGDSVIVNHTINSIQAGNYNIIAEVDFTSDEDTSNNKSIDNFIVVREPNTFNNIIINEIMYSPSSTQNEWIELYNRSDSVINIRNWSLSDNGTTVSITNKDFILAPKSFVVLSQDSSLLNIFTNSIQLLIIPNMPSLNNSGDAVIIHDSLGLLIDSLSYFSTWGGDNGKSLERIDPNVSSILQSNWGTSNNLLGATPGGINSLTQKDFNIGVSEVIFNPEKPFVGDNVDISAIVNNTGKNTVLYSLQLFEDINSDLFPDVLLETKSNLTINPTENKTEFFNYQITNLQNKREFIVKAVLANDQDTTDNSKYISIEPGYPKSTILINEIMYTPVGGEPEWVEIYNTSSDSINLFHWTITDRFATPVSAIINENVFIPPKSYLVVARDSSIFNFHKAVPSKLVILNLPGLNNDADGVVLRDDRNLTIDSVLYNNSWGGTSGYSLERKDFSVASNLSGNWSSSTDNEMSTPGRINSISNRHFDLTAVEISFDPQYPVAGDNVTPTLKVINKGQSSANNFSVMFYIDTNSDNVPDQLLSTESGLSLNAFDSAFINSSTDIEDLQSKVLVGANIVFSQDEDTLNNYSEAFTQPGFAHNSMLINEIMYAPETGKPEWIELINNSNESLNLKNWSISDILPSPTKNFITTADLMLNPDEFLILTKDSTFFNQYPSINSQIKIVNFGSLGNIKDGIIVYDFRDAVIDSMFYSSNWGGGKGFSLERISQNNPTNDSTNWTTSLSVNHSTPGQANSINNIVQGIKGELIINEIMYNPGENNTEFIEFYNNSSKDVNIGGWKIIDENGNMNKLSKTSLIIPSKNYFILSADSSLINYYNLENKIVSILNKSSLGLVNSGELILLEDFLCNTIDSVFYSDKWNNSNFTDTKNKSLERINPSIDGNDKKNWSTSVNHIGATPGEQNSIFTIKLQSQSNLTISPNPFSPDNDGFEDFTIISYNLTQPIAQVKVKIYDSKGRLVKILDNNLASGSTGSIIFNGLDDDGNPLRIGIYIVYLEALNQNSGTVEAMKAALVVARKFN
ncbi:MAG: lamin tail domain-containing protein [Bacteroidetes bacterium]|nr:lamin tail domain-containing protein [Bacteroidota bacterium]